VRIAKPLLLVITPLGVAAGLYEAWRLAGGLVFLMVMMLTVVGAAIASVVFTIRREQAAERDARKRDGISDASRGHDE
jgi:hypothetical protein